MPGAPLQLPDIEPEWTPRQREVLDLLVRGRTNGEIAETLGVSLQGAKFHVSVILSKLQVTSREEAAEYWRHRNGLRTRFLRVGGGALSPLALRWAAGGAVAAVAVAAGLAIALAVLSNDDDGDEAGAPLPSTPTESAAATTTQTPTPLGLASATPGPVLTPFPTVSNITQVSVPRGSTITGGYGLLVGNPATGGAEVWLLPESSQPQGVSPKGRYFVFESELIDAWSGTRVAVPLRGRTLKATFAPDDSAVVVQTDAEAALLAQNGSIITRFPDFETERTAEAMWSADSRAVALSRTSDSGSRVDVVVDRVLRPALPSNGMAAWSRTGHRLAVTGDRPAIYDYDSGGRVLALERGGTFPAWSGDDAFVAVQISVDDVPGLSAIDTADGKEVMRVYNQAACFLIYWYEGPALPGISDTGAFAVPSGEVIPFQPIPIPASPSIGFEFGSMRWLDAAGQPYAEVRVDAMWAASFAWIRRDIESGFPPVLFLGRGGQDACIGSASGVVAKPPFTPDQVPTPTPTPDK